MTMRKSVVANKGMVASAHHLASKAGTDVLSNGGNVVDAAITTSAVLCVVENNSCGLGGDAFVLFKLGSKIREINGSGRSARSATIERYEKEGMREIPARGPLACITVPGLVHAWGELLKFATMDLGRLLAPAIDYAENGVPLNYKYVESIRLSFPIMQRYGGWKKLFMPDGEVPAIGFVLRQRDLANSLKMIAREGVRTYYDGPLAELIVKGLKRAGCLLDNDDFKKHTSTLVEPIWTEYRGTRIYETSPNSQAATVLLWLNMLENYDLRKVSDSESLLIETCIKAYEHRAKSIADPSFFPLPANFVSKHFAKQVLSSHSEWSQSAHQKDETGDTTYFAIGDREGNVVSMIQSNYNGFGSGVVPEGTGIVLQNRGSYFSLNSTHHNALAPGKRTFHTLCASIGERNDKTLFAIGTMGGDIQPQIHVQLMNKMLDSGIDIQEAIDSPRWFIPATIYEKPTTINFEKGLDSPKKMLPGMKTKKMNDRTSQAGHANGIYFSEASILGAADPRCSGSAVGF